MYGLKKYAQTKTKRFASDKDRKRHFAIQSYYAKKKSASSEKAFTVKK